MKMYWLGRASSREGTPVIPVRILPNFGVDHGRMEAVKDAEGQRDALDDGPWQEAVKVELNGIGFDFLHFKSVDEPQGHVGDEQESDGLSARLLQVLLGFADAPSGDVRDENRLHRHFDDGQEVVDEDQSGRFFVRTVQRSGNHRKCRVAENAQGGDSK